MPGYYIHDNVTNWFLAAITETYEAVEDRREEIDMAVQNNNTAQLKSICHDILQDWDAPSSFFNAAVNSINFLEMLQELKQFLEDFKSVG
jgi:hypothetical protein